MNQSKPSREFKVRQKVQYTGDRANASGYGAIIEMTTFSAVIILEDGRTINHPINDLRHVSERHKCLYRILVEDEFASAEEILVLKAAKVSKQALHEAEKKAKETAHAAQVEQLKAEYPDLVSSSDRNAVSKNIRKLLKKAFPDVRFSVRKESYTSVNIGWEDGPTTAAVEAIANRFEYGHFNGQEDIYEYNNSAWTNLFGGVKFLFTRRECSDESTQIAIDMLVAEYGGPAPTIEAFKAGDLYQESPIGNWGGYREHSWQTLIHRKLADLSFPIGFASFDALEVSAVVEYPETDEKGKRRCERIDMATVNAMEEKSGHHVFYSVYGHVPGKGADCIADFESAYAADRFAEMMKDKWPNIGHIEKA